MIKTLTRRFVEDDRGLELVEYAVMAALIVAALITAIVGLSAAIQGKFGTLTTTITNN
jgi:Flp pilus assembly pilin Flp